MSEVVQIKKVNVVQETFKVILKMIMEGKWKEGEKIPSENDFKDMLGVSRHTVRAALNNLNMLGIVETKQGDGNYVKFVGVGLYIDMLIPYLFINENNINVIMEFREGIEAVTARYAAQRATQKDIQKLGMKLQRCTELTDDMANYLVADFDFHYNIAKVSKNELLLQSMYVVKKYCFDSLSKYMTKTISVDGTQCHERIYEAIKTHDPDSAAQYMNEHILRVMKMVESNDRESNERLLV